MSAARSLPRGERGASVVEVALAVAVLITVILAIFEVMRMLTINAAIESGVRAASRYGITGALPASGSREEEIIRMIEARSLGMANRSNTRITTSVFDSYEAIPAMAEFFDKNGKPKAGRAGAGGANEIVVYTATYQAPHWLPGVASLFGGDGIVRLRASTAVRNEPYEGRT